MNKYIVYSHPEGISLNGRQYLLGDNDELLKFDSPKAVMDYLAQHGIEATTEDELEEYDIWITKEDE